MIMNKRSIAYITIAVTAAVTLISCSRKESENGYTKVEQLNKCTTEEFEPFYHEGYNSYPLNVVCHDNKYIILVQQYPENTRDSDEALHYRIVTYENGAIVSDKLIGSMDGLYCDTACFVNDDTIAAGFDSSMDFISISEDEIIDHVDTDSPIYSMRPSDEGVILLFQDQVSCYSIEDKTMDSVPLGDIQCNDDSCSAYEVDGGYYLTAGRESAHDYYMIDFENDRFEKLLSESDTGYVGSLSTDNYLNTSTGMTRIDFADRELVEYISWNMIDIRPETKDLQEDYYYTLGRDLMIIHKYNDGSFDCQLIKNSNEEPKTDKMQITVGGYGVNEDLAVKWAVYKYNTTHDDQRIVLVDYGDDYSYSNAAEAQVQFASLIQRFNSGDAPDIYYGFNFDHGYMYRNGMIRNLSGYDLDPSRFSDNIYDLFCDRSGEPYVVFAGYYLNGYFGLKDIFEDGDVSWRELEEISERTGITPLTSLESGNIADIIIRYGFEDMAYGSSGHVIDTSELTDIIQFSIDHGVPANSPDVMLSGYREIYNRQYLTYLGFQSDYGFFRDMESECNCSFVFLGYPSIEGSVHVANPVGLLSMSSGTDHPDECWDFMQLVFDYDIQRIINDNGRIPVCEDALEDYIADLKAEGEPQWIIDDYLEMIGSVDSRATYDWGLYSIIWEEINSYDLAGKTPEQIAESLQSRLDLYAAENYT